MRFARGTTRAFAALLALPFLACAGAECSTGTDYCEGNVAWVCNGGGDKGPLKWETQDCGEGSTCRGGTCFADPLIACTEAQVGEWYCDPGRTYPGICLAAGYWAWDLSRPCLRENEEICAFYREPREDGTVFSAAMCVVTPESRCTPGTSNPVCHNDILTDCTSIGIEAKVRDCAADGMVCRNGACAK